MQKKIQIWTYWHSIEEVPPFLHVLIEEWARFPGHEVTILDDNNFTQYVSRAKPANYEILDSRRKSEWVRTAVVYEHGGCWIDASIVLLQPLTDFVSFSHDITIFNQQRITTCIS